MGQCKSCLAETYYCGSCDYDFISSQGYCSLKCFKNSKEYQNNITLLKSFYTSLNNDQKTQLDKVIGLDSYYHDLDFDKLVIP